jgi:transcriptional regulator with XRE-family HTH domain
VRMPVRSEAHRAFGEAIRAVRKREGVSQEELALRCGLDRTYLSGIERGVRNPSLTNVLRIAAALHTSPAELFTRMQELQAHDRRAC